MISMCFRSDSGEPLKYRSSLRNDPQINPSAADVWYAYVPKQKPQILGLGSWEYKWNYVCIVRTVSGRVFKEKCWLNKGDTP